MPPLHAIGGSIFMSNIKKAFDHGKAFIGFVTAGDPSLEKTEEFVLTMEEAGCDLIELGIPFSDPIAEGPVIQEANIRALKAGANLDRIFQTVESLRKKTDIPLVFLTYLNPVFRYGYEKFFARCAEAGVDGVIIPDLPFEEKGEVTPFSRKNAVNLISLVAPTSEDRIRTIAADADGFLYLVSSMGVTGMQSAAFDTFMNDLCESQNVALRVCYENAFCLSADVTAAYDPNFADVYEKRNAAFVNHGVGLCKYTGARGKSGSSDANAETVGYVRGVLDKAGVRWQICEMGKIDAGGGGTVAQYMANRNIATLDAGVPVLSMHAPFEVVAKLDCYEMYRACKALYESL